jgi:replication-associated recombination protein RarA
VAVDRAGVRREVRRLLKYNVEVGKEAAALLAVVATGDARAMLDVLSEVD